MTRADKAEALFREGYNCAQSVFGAFADVAEMELKDAVKLISAYGAGFGKLREVCGAVSGMTALAGMLKGYHDPNERQGKIELYQLTQKMANEFKERQGTIICREMLNLKPGEDLPEPAVRTEEYYQSRPCVKAVRDAADIIEEYLL